ncbi:recombinase family protein [soil metagenome]
MQPKSTQRQLRAAIYTRVSSDRQEREGASLDTQLAACREYAGDHGYEIVGEYQDVHTGGQYRERPGLSGLRQLVRAGSVDVVISHAVDRLSRAQAHLYIITEEVEDHGGRLEFVTEKFEDSATGRFLMSAKGFAAEVEREKRAENAMRGRRNRARNGKPISGRLLYGYRYKDVERTKVEPDPITAPIVKRIYHEASTGKTLRQIGFGLTGDGIPTPSGKSKAWDISSLRYILRHPNYTGDAYAFYATRRETSDGWIRDLSNAMKLPDGTYPALVEWDLWEAVQQRLTRNQRESARSNSAPHEALLRGGVARCGYCGHALHAKKRSYGDGVRQYKCNGRNDTDVYCEGRPAMMAHALDAIVWEKVQAVLKDPSLIARELERMYGTDPSEADLAAINRSISALDRQRNNIQRAIAMLDNPDAMGGLVAQLSSITDQISSMQSERDAVITQHEHWHEARRRLGDIQAWCKRVAAHLDRLTYTEKQTALEALGVAVTLYRANHEPRYTVTMSIPLDPCVEPGVTRSIGP